jgi:outer membrane protein assembly factor BamB
MRAKFVLRLLASLLAFSPAVARADDPQINDRYPIKSGDELSSPIVWPVGDCARAVHVTGYIAHAIVKVIANGVEQVGLDNPRLPEADIQLSRPLTPSDSIRATQTVRGFTSAPSVDPVIPNAYPTPLNQPVVNPLLYACGRDVPVDQLNPGTHVSVYDNKNSNPLSPIGEQDVTLTRQGVVTSQVREKDSVTAQQTACPAIPSKKVSSPISTPVAVLHDPSPIPIVSVEAYVAGEDAVTMDNLVAGAEVIIVDKTTNGVIGDCLANNSQNWCGVNPPIKQTTRVSVTQKLCSPSDPSTPQPPSKNLNAPSVDAPVCEGSHYVSVRGLVINSVVVIFRNGNIAGMAGGVPGDDQMALGGGATWAFADQVQVVEYVGNLIANSNTVIVDCKGGGNVVTQHNNNYRSGVYLSETTLTPARVLARGMAVKYSHPVDAAMAAQPLYVRNGLADGKSSGLFVATLNNSVYALDADSGVQQWSKQLVDSDVSARGLARGISATPVIDIPSHRIYVLFSTKNQPLDKANCPNSAMPDPSCGTYEDQLSGLDVAYWLVALDFRDGSEIERVQVSASLTRSDGTPLNFVAKNQYDRPALLLDHGSIYLAFAMRHREEVIEYHGWVIRYSAADLSPQGAFCTSKDFTVPTSPYTNTHPVDGAGIWGGGGGLSADSDGNVYFLTGNGRADVANGWFGDTFVKLAPSGSSLVATGFTPTDAAALAEYDADLGAGGTMVLPSTKLVIGGGKTGYMYLLDRGSMSLVEQLTAATDQYDPSQRIGGWDWGPHLHGSPTYWRGPDPTYGYLYVWGEKDVLRQYRFNTATNMIDSSAVRFGMVQALRDTMPGGMISVSAFGNSAGTGILWVTLPAADSTVPGSNSNPGRLYAFNAETLQPLWDAGFSSMGKWLEPTIADGKVFVGTGSNEVVAYALAPVHRSGRSGTRQEKPFQPTELQAKVPLHERYPDEASMRALPAIALGQLAPEGKTVVALALRGEGQLTYEAADDPQEAGKLKWRLKDAVASLWRVSIDRPADRQPALVRLTSGATWTASDGSKITGEVQKSFPAPDRAATPWTLLKVSQRRGKGLLSNVQYVQAVFTEGGQPAKPRPDRLGLVERVPYNANYIFYRER